MDGTSLDSNLEAQRVELEAVLASRMFRRAPALSKILRYVCEKHFAGVAETIKEYNVAVEALGRRQDFDPSASSIVRVEASRLRKRLRQYYETEGAGHRLQIHLAESGYKPCFASPAAADRPAKLSRQQVGPAPVFARPPEPGPATSALPPTRLDRGPRFRLAAWPLAAAALALALGLLAIYIVQHRHPARPAPLTAVPLTTYPGREIEPTISPDGRSVAFVWDGRAQNNFDIYVKLIATGDPVRLTTDPAEDFGPAWSPDGRKIAFLRRRKGERADLLQIPALGGSEIKLATIYAPEAWHLRLAGPFLTWSPDGEWLVVSDKESPGESPALFLFSPRTGVRHRLTKPKPELIGDTAPAFSPDGHSLAFARMFGPYEHEIFVMPVSETYLPEGPPRQLTAETNWSRQPTWGVNGREIVYSRGRGRLWRVPVSGKSRPRRLAYVGETGIYPTVNLQRRRLVYSNYTRDTNIWKLSLSQAAPPKPFVASSLPDLQPRYSPTGDRIAFLSNRSGRREIWLCDADGENTTRLTSLGRLGSPQWSPEGRAIAFDHRPQGQSDIYVIDVSGRNLRRLTQSSAADLMPSWSRDGEWIYFSSNRSGEFQIWRMPSTGGEPDRVTQTGGVFALEGADGKNLYVARRRGDTSLWKHRLKDGSEKQLIPSVHYHYFTLAPGGIYYVERGKDRFGGDPLRHFRLADGKVTTLHTLQKPTNPGITVAPDGRTLLFTQLDHETADLMLVEDFR